MMTDSEKAKRKNDDKSKRTPRPWCMTLLILMGVTAFFIAVLALCAFEVAFIMPIP